MLATKRFSGSPLSALAQMKCDLIKVADQFKKEAVIVNDDDAELFRTCSLMKGITAGEPRIIASALRACASLHRYDTVSEPTFVIDSIGFNQRLQVLLVQ